MPDAGDAARPLRRRAARLLRRSGGARRGGALPAPGHRRARHPRGAARGGRRALLRPRRAQPDQRPQPRPAGAAAGRARPARHRHPAAVGQPQLRAVLRRRRARGARPRGHRGWSPCSRAPTRATRRAGSTARTSPPRSRRSARPPTASSSTRCARTPCTPASASPGGVRCVEAVRSLPDPASAHLLYVTHSVPEAMDDTSGPGRRRGQPLRRPARAPGPPAHRRGQRRAGPRASRASWCSARAPGPPTQPWLEPDVNDRIEELAARGRGHRRVRADRVRLRPHGGRARPRHRGRRDGRAGRGAVRAGARRPAPTSCSSRGWSTSSSSGPPRPAARWSSPRPGCPVTCGPRSARPGCCPNLRTAKPALCGSD